MDKKSINNLKTNLKKLSQYKLYRKPKYKKIIILSTPKIIDKGHSGKLNQKHKNEIKNQIDNFVEKIQKNIPQKYLTTMYNNLYNLTIKEEDLYLIIYNKVKNLYTRGIRGGMYLPDENKISIYSEKGLNYLKETFELKKDITLERIYTHELLHMSTTIRKNQNYFTGFHHDYQNLSIGLGLNEGYTELLNERIFNATNVSGTYAFYKEVSRIIELAIGEERMTELYFTSNLKDLYLDLTKYISPDKTKKFILELDNIRKNKKHIPSVIEYLVLLVNNKILNDYKENKITYKEATIKYQKLQEILEKLNIIINRITNNDEQIKENIIKNLSKIKLTNENYTQIKKLSKR